MNMFKPTAAKTVNEYIELIPEPRRIEFRTLHELILRTLPDERPFIQTGMIGYGKYHYKYPSGREGDWALIALASQKNYISPYICSIDEHGYLAEQFKDQLPKTNIGKSCIRIRHLEDVDLAVIKEILLKAKKIGGMGQVLA